MNRAALNAERTLRSGGLLGPPISLPFRVVARTCSTCGELVTTPAARLRKTSAPAPACQRCSADRVREWSQRRRDAGFRGTDPSTARAQTGSLETVRRRHVEWTGPELEVACRSDLTSLEVARLLGRTLYAVVRMRRRLRTEPQKDRLAGIVTTAV